MVKVVWTVSDTWQRQEIPGEKADVAGFVLESDAIVFAGNLNAWSPVPRYQVERSLSVNGGEAV